eukprot:scaffold9735_cov174-Amphora_coffeaeformis.AAC.5
MEATVASSQQYADHVPQHSTQTQHHQQQGGGRGSFHVLYTKHKTQKRKIWQDGRLAVQTHAVTLHAANPPPGGGDPALDTCVLQPAEMQALWQRTLTNLETEKFLVQVDGPWQGSGGVPPSWGTGSSNGSKAAPSVAMQKLLQRKFRKPAVKRPPPSTQPPAFLQQRKRPLQPGELQRTYFGPPSEQQQHPAPQQHPPMHQQRNTMYAQPCDPPPMHRHQHASNGPTFDTHRSAPEYLPTMNRQQPTPPRHQSQFYNTRGSQTWGQPQNAPPLSHDALSQRPPPFSGNRAVHIQNNPAPSSTPNVKSSYAPGAPTQNSDPPPYRQGWDTSNPVAPRGVVTRKGGDFVSNAFDPKGFYGEDGEEEEEEEEEDFCEQQMGPLLRQSSTVAARRNDEYAAPESFVNNATVEVADNDQNKALTTDDLLDLFGGDSTQAESVAEDSAKTQVHSANDVNAEPKIDASVEGNDDFVLPPPSESSDDEDD